MEGARRFLVPFVLILAGCHGTPPPIERSYAPAPVPYVPSTDGSNAFDAYVLAARQAEDAIATSRSAPLRRTFFTPKQRKDLLKALGPALARIAGAKSACRFHYVPARPGEMLPGRAAWRLLGRALRWRIDDDLDEASAQNAVTDATIAFRFGNDLCGGGPADRSLGAEIANDAREAILPALSRLDKVGLHHLADAVKAGLSRRAPLDETLANADADMALAIQSLQEAVRANDYRAIQGDMGKEFRDMEGLKDLSVGKRSALFESLDGDRQRLIAAWRAAAGLPASKRAKLLDIKLRGDKTQRAFARHYFLIGRPLLSIEDRSVARLRLLVLEAELRRSVQISGHAPSSLDAVRRPWGIDPYSGRTFGYQPDGTEFRVYSVGANLKDDLGDTDAAGLEPDIRTVLP